MRAVEIIEKKRDGRELTKDEIEFFIHGFSRDEIPDYQMTAWAMAVLLNGMTTYETADMTMAMAETGEMLDLSGITPRAVDKHSTGGVGDKTSLVVGPIVAACGLAVAKMSGHGLGFTGGTLDKLESIPGFRSDLSTREFLEQLQTIGLVISGQSADLAPADGKLYSLRDVTGTIPSIPLIASSIMSKKIAAGAKLIVLDVKVGLGAFMQNLESARELADLMVSIADRSGRQVKVLLSDMNQPLGQAVGNSLELKEALASLRGDGPADFHQHCLAVSAQMLILGQVVSSVQQGKKLAQEKLNDGSPYQLFKKMVSAQQGDVSYIEKPERLAVAPFVDVIKSNRSGYLLEIDARSVGETTVFLGAGRTKKGEAIDHAVGVEVHIKVGDHIQVGGILFTIHARTQEALNWARQQLMESIQWSDDPVEPLPLFYGVIPE